MQFGCESCKAQLQIADEKVRGKRLIVRCRRCGAKISRFPRTFSSAICSCALQLSQPNCIRPGLYLKSQGGQEGKGGRPQRYVVASAPEDSAARRPRRLRPRGTSVPAF